MRKIVIHLVLLALLAGGPAYSQNMFSSPYSVYGIGFLHQRGSLLNQGMAGTGIGVRDPYNLNPLNPASYGAINAPISHIFETGIYVETMRYHTTRTQDSKTGGGMSHANYWFKFAPWWAATGGLTPYSSVSYNITTQKQFGSGTNADYTYRGSGNISQLYLGNAFRITPNLSAGFHVSYLFGSLSKNEAVRANNADLVSLQSSVRTNKFHLDFGVQYQFKLSEYRSLVVGAVADNGLKLSGEQQYTLLYSLDTLNHYTSPDHLNYKLPASGGMGISLNTRRSILAYDMKYTHWTAAQFGNQNVDFRDTWRYSVGYSYLGNPHATRMLDLIIVRTGFYIEDYYLKLKGNTFPMWGFSLGMSVPAFDNRSSINLTYSYDRFGTTRDDLIQQRSQKIILGITIRDLWGIRRKFD